MAERDKHHPSGGFWISTRVRNRFRLLSAPDAHVAGLGATRIRKSRWCDALRSVRGIGSRQPCLPHMWAPGTPRHGRGWLLQSPPFPPCSDATRLFTANRRDAGHQCPIHADTGPDSASHSDTRGAADRAGPADIGSRGNPGTTSPAAADCGPGYGHPWADRFGFPAIQLDLRSVHRSRPVRFARGITAEASLDSSITRHAPK